MTGLDLARIGAGAFVSVVCAGAVPLPRRRLGATLIAALVACYALVGHLESWRGVVVVVVCAAVGGWYWPARRWWRLAAAVGLGVFAVVLVSPHASRLQAHLAVTSGRVAVIVFGLLVATFACGELIGTLTRRLVQNLKPPEGEAPRRSPTPAG